MARSFPAASVSDFDDQQLMPFTRAQVERIKNRLKNFGNDFARTYTLSISPDGIDLAVKNDDDSYWKTIKMRATNPFVIVTTFFGLPNRTLDDEPLTWSILCKNFVGYRKNQRLATTILLACIMIPLHLITMPVKFLTNVARLCIEILPQLLRQTCFLLAEILLLYYPVSRNILENTIKSKPARLGARLLKGFFLDLPIALLMAALLSTIVLSYPLYYVGRATTSPIDSARGDWVNWRRRLYSRDGLNPPPIWLFYIVASIAVAVRIATTAVVFAFLLPLTAKGIGLLFAPLVAAHTPAAIAAVLHFLTIVGNAISPAAPAFASFVSAAAMGLAPFAAVISAAIASVGFMLKTTYLKALSRFYDPKPQRRKKDIYPLHFKVRTMVNVGFENYQ